MPFEKFSGGIFSFVNHEIFRIHQVVLLEYNDTTQNGRLTASRDLLGSLRTNMQIVVL